MSSATAAVPVSAERTRRAAGIDTLFLLVSLSVLMVVTTHSQLVMDEDIWWHLRTGNWILAHGAVPVKDTFSAGAMGKPWIVYSWLFDVLVSRIFDIFGYRGMLAWATCAALAYTSWLTVFLARFTNLRRAIILSFAAYLTAMPLKSPRPWLFTILFFTIELSLLWIARERNRPAWLLPIVPLFVVWANLHIQFVYGLGLIGLFALDSSLPESWRKALSAEPRPALQGLWLWVLLAVSSLATLLNPYGWSLYRVVWEYASQSAPLVYIQEMQSLPFRGLPNWIALFLIVLAVFALGAAPRKNVLLIALLAFASYFGLRSQRDVWFPVTVALITLASQMKKPEGFVRSPCNYWIAIPVGFAVSLLFMASYDRFSNAALRQAAEEHFPEKASRFVEAHHLQGPIFNSYNWGGYLIWRLPGLPVSIDGRANLYEDTLATAANTFTGQKGWSDDPSLKRARTLILEGNGALASILRVDPRYRLLYEDKTAAVFQPSGLPAPTR